MSQEWMQNIFSYINNIILLLFVTQETRVDVRDDGTLRGVRVHGGWRRRGAERAAAPGAPSARLYEVSQQKSLRWHMRQVQLQQLMYTTY